MKVSVEKQLRIGLIGAMESEIEHLTDAMVAESAYYFGGMNFVSGTLHGLPVVVCSCGVGKVNAALCVQILADRFNVSHVVNTGVAGSLDPSLNIGDLVVSIDALQHDMDVCNLGYLPGQIPGFASASFYADPQLQRRALEAISEAAPEVRGISGRIASGDQFVRTDAAKIRISQIFEAACVEMEGAAVAQACYLNDLPFVIIRAISDKADGSDAEDYPVFEEKAARHCARVVEYMIQAWSGQVSVG